MSRGKNLLTKKIVKIRTPGNKISIHLKKKRYNPHVCYICGSKLHGVINKPKGQLTKLSKSKKTVSRPYGGKVCHSCLSNSIKAKVRSGGVN
ncbi:MAG: 50S ribosomal protein L34e [Candidatus Odinarchaeia archaeon]